MSAELHIDTKDAIGAIRVKNYHAARLALQDGYGVLGRDGAGRDVIEFAAAQGAGEWELRDLRKGLTDGLIRLTRIGQGASVAHLAKHCVVDRQHLVYGVPHTLGSAAAVNGCGPMLDAWLTAGGNAKALTPSGVPIDIIARANGCELLTKAQSLTLN